ncbi:MAG: 1,4-alpha-glucan branching protein GlgB [Clostridia bacterium]|nr:1,4-alpha-glucan branching protein GlgB [Clostridia bacterium]
MYDHNRIKNHVKGVEASSYELFGAHIERSGVFFSVFAPFAASVSVSIDAGGHEDVPMRRDMFGVWCVMIAGIGEGARYKYKIWTEDGECVEKSDPFAFYNEVRPNTASIVYDIDNYGWRDGEWIAQREKNYDRPLNIYEVHLGTWKVKDGEGDERFYRYEELKTELVPYVRDMGYTHIEFMPMCEYPFDGSWGYQATGFYAPTSRYGEPRYFMDLIDTCHLNGIGVILDFVPVHFATDSHGLAKFDGEYLYESDSEQMRESEWGSYRFDYSKPHVQSFVRSAINFWINKYHIDGVRFDAAAYMMYLHANPDEPEYDCGVWFLKSTLYTLGAYHPDVMFIAEDVLCREKDTAPVIYGGMGFDYLWNFGWSSQTRRYMSLSYDERREEHSVMTYPMYYFNTGLFILSISHDDVSEGKGTLINNIYGDSQEEKFAALRTYYMYQITHPGKKHNFMGNELAEYMAWNNEQPLGWNLLTYPIHDSYHEFVRDANFVYKTEEALFSREYDLRAFTWVDLENSGSSIYAYRRDDREGTPLFVVLNFSHDECDYYLEVGFDTYFREILNSDTDIYGGSNVRNYNLSSRDGYLKIHMSGLSGVILKPCEENEVDVMPEYYEENKDTPDEQYSEEYPR